MEAQAERVIDLTEFQNLGLILKTNSGVFYTNQSAGFACSHPKIEGVFDPLPIRLGNTELLTLGLQFRGSWEHISEADAEQIDTILRRNRHDNVSVDRSKLNHSFEAWVHVMVGGETANLSGFGFCEGVLIWPNSD